MTRETILQLAREQSAIDLHCSAADFTRTDPVIVHSQLDERARRYLTLPFSCQLVSYGPNVVASVQPDLEEAVRGYVSRYAPYHCFETRADLLHGGIFPARSGTHPRPVRAL